jgi:hypothetical protein
LIDTIACSHARPPAEGPVLSVGVLIVVLMPPFLPALAQSLRALRVLRLARFDAVGTDLQHRVQPRWAALRERVDPARGVDGRTGLSER